MPFIRMRSLKVLIAGAVLACGGGGDGGGGIVNPPPPPPPGGGTPSASASITMGSASFSPSSVSITRTGTVTWNNTSGVTHNVTFANVSGAPTDIGDHSNGQNSRTFNATGTFNFSCTLHGGMNGSVSVQ